MPGIPGNQHNLRHGHTSNGKKSPEYKAWESMIQRCYNPTTPSYPNYGERGIRVCERWRHSFEKFLADVGLRPSPRHSLDRKKNSGNYTPKNCRWATPEEQQGNTRSNRKIRAFGRVQILSDWAREKGIPLDTLWRRLSVYEWPPEKALSEPLREKKVDFRARVLAAGYASVSAFILQNNFSPAVVYGFANGKPQRPETKARIEALLSG